MSKSDVAGKNTTVSFNLDVWSAGVMSKTTAFARLPSAGRTLPPAPARSARFKSLQPCLQPPELPTSSPLSRTSFEPHNRRLFACSRLSPPFPIQTLVLFLPIHAIAARKITLSGGIHTGGSLDPGLWTAAPYVQVVQGKMAPSSSPILSGGGTPIVVTLESLGQTTVMAWRIRLG